MRTALICLILFLASGVVFAAQPIPVIFDTDIGGDIDDTWALAYLLRSPELDLKLLVTDHGVAVNPRRTDVREQLESKGIEVVDIETLCQRAMTLTGEPAQIEFDEQIVGYVRYRDGSVIDVIRRVKQ